MDQSIFKAYDIRGIYPDQINEEVAYKIAQAYAKLVNPKVVAVGMDVRLSGPKLFEAVRQGLLDHGVDVVNVGVISTDMLYFAVANYGYDGGITVSASHNPKEYNGLKMVRKNAVPISGDSGIMEIKDLVAQGYAYKSETPGEASEGEIVGDYVQKCLSMVDVLKLKELKVVVNAMFGPAFLNVRRMNLPINFIELNTEPDGNFPKGQPDPMQEQNRLETIEAVKTHRADLGVAWDADADRCFIFDENGRFIPGYYLTAFLGEYFARQNPGSKVIVDPRLIWATQDKVAAAGGAVLVNKSGHSFIKERMRREDAIFGGEMSGHFYFRDYFYADNGLIPFLLMLQIVSETGKKVSELFDEYFVQYPISGEINTKLSALDQVPPILEKIRTQYADAQIDQTDGLSVAYPDWRANIRGSNTEPLIRLNVEAKNEEILKQKTEELKSLIP